MDAESKKEYIQLNKYNLNAHKIYICLNEFVIQQVKVETKL